MGTPTPPPPPLAVWRELHALWPLLILVALVPLWTKLQFGFMWSAITTSTGLALAALKYLAPAVGDIKTELANTLRSNKRASQLWKAFAIFVAISLVVGSAKVSADKLPYSVAIYRVDPEGVRNGDASARGQKMLDAGNSERSFYIGLPFGKRVYLASSRNEMSRALTVYPWTVPSVAYPSGFSSLPELAVLLAPRIRLHLGGQRWLRLVVIRDGKSPMTLAEDTLRTFESLMVVFDTSSLSDEAAKARWLPFAKDSLSLDSDDAQIAVEDWLKRRVVRSSEPLLPGQRIRLILLNQAKDTIKAAAVTLAAGLSNVVLRE